MQKTLPLVIANLPQLAVTTTSLNSGTVNQAYSTPLAATGGQAPYTFIGYRLASRSGRFGQSDLGYAYRWL